MSVLPVDPSSPEFFEARYQSEEDPWAFATSAYERFRYERILAALGSRHFNEAFEPACSVGVLTAMLAPLCGALLAVDLSPSAVSRAEQRCDSLANVTLRCAGFEEIAPRKWDLLVLSEIGYYFLPDRWRVLAGERVHALAPGATVLGCHWLGHSPDHRMHGEQVQAILRENSDLHRTHSERHENFLLETWSRR